MKQKYQFVEHKGNLNLFTVDRNGQLSPEPYRWEIEEKSMLPKGVFILIVSFIRAAIKHCPANATYRDYRKAFRIAIGQAARACGCVYRLSTETKIAFWLLDGDELIGFQTHEAKINKKRLKKLLRSEAKLRFAVVLRDGGSFKIESQKSRIKK